MADLDADEVATRMAFALPRHASQPLMLGYAVIETDADGNYPSYCVHGPDPVDTSYEDARIQRAYLAKDARPGQKYVVCKLVPAEGEADA